MNHIYAPFAHITRQSFRMAALICSIVTMVLSFTACVDNQDATHHPQITAQSLPAANTNILSIKQKFSSVLTQNNTFKQVNEDLLFEGVVVANDISGNLYQTLVMRHIGSKVGELDDQCISLGVKSSQLYPYFPLGQRIRVNLKNLYIGNYSKTPKVGRPYYTSSGNLRLGPMFLDDVATNVALVGKPNPQAPELTPRDFTSEEGVEWLSNRANQSYLVNPMLVSVRGIATDVMGAEKNKAATGQLSGKKEPLPKIFAPKELYDAGFGVDRPLQLLPQDSSNPVSLSLRTSVRNAISFLPIPEVAKTYTGVMTYYTGWQLQLRDVKDIK